MTVRALIDRILAHLSEDERSIPEASPYFGRVAAALGALNGAAEEISQRARLPVVARNRSGLLNAPASVTITVTAGSKTATIPHASYASWMPGCSVRVGSATWNRIDSATDGPSTATLTLLDPWLGESGATDATIYHDALLVDEDLVSVQAPVVAVDSAGAARELRPASLSLLEWTVPGVPLWFDLESAPDGSDSAAPRTLIHVSPQPDRKLVLRYRSRVRMGGWNEDDLDESTSPEIPVPSAMAESVLLPIALQRFTASPFWRNKEAAEEIARQYQVAMAFLDTHSPNKASRLSLSP